MHLSLMAAAAHTPALEGRVLGLEGGRERCGEGGREMVRGLVGTLAYSGSGSALKRRAGSQGLKSKGGQLPCL